MRFCPDSPSFLFVQLLFLAWLHLSGPRQPGVFAQCDAELPSGNTCTQEDFFMEADPEVSSLTLQMRIYKIKKFCTLRSKHNSMCYPGLLLFLRVLGGVCQSQAVPTPRGWSSAGLWWCECFNYIRAITRDTVLDRDLQHKKTKDQCSKKFSGFWMVWLDSRGRLWSPTMRRPCLVRPTCDPAKQLEKHKKNIRTGVPPYQLAQQ